MKIFSLTALLSSLAAAVFGIAEGNFLMTFSSIFKSAGFVFLCFYAKNRSAGLMDLFAVRPAIHVFLNFIRIFTEKGYL